MSGAARVGVARVGVARAGVAWADFEVAAPAMAAFVRERLLAHPHRYLATTRADGSPRLSGIELTIHAGQVWIGSMPGSFKMADLRRDPRLAIHSGCDDPPALQGDARLSGVALFEEDEAVKADFLVAAGGGPPGPFELVRLRITQASTAREAEGRDHLVIDAWRPGGPLRSLERR